MLEKFNLLILLRKYFSFLKVLFIYLIEEEKLYQVFLINPKFILNLKLGNSKIVISKTCK